MRPGTSWVRVLGGGGCAGTLVRGVRSVGRVCIEGKEDVGAGQRRRERAVTIDEMDVRMSGGSTERFNGRRVFAGDYGRYKGDELTHRAIPAPPAPPDEDVPSLSKELGGIHTPRFGTTVVNGYLGASMVR